MLLLPIGGYTWRVLIMVELYKLTLPYSLSKRTLDIRLCRRRYSSHISSFQWGFSNKHNELLDKKRPKFVLLLRSCARTIHTQNTASSMLSLILAQRRTKSAQGCISHHLCTTISTTKAVGAVILLLFYSYPSEALWCPVIGHRINIFNVLTYNIKIVQ